MCATDLNVDEEDQRRLKEIRNTHTLYCGRFQCFDVTGCDLKCLKIKACDYFSL